MRVWALCLLLICSCSLGGYDDLLAEMKQQVETLVKELQKIETKEDLERSQIRLEKSFFQLARLLAQASQFEVIGEEKKLPSFLEEELFTELARIYEIPDLKEIVEKTQMKACSYLAETL